MNIPVFRDSFLGFKILKYFYAGPNPRIFCLLIRDPGWKNSDPGSGINIPDPQHFYFVLSAIYTNSKPKNLGFATQFLDHPNCALARDRTRTVILRSPRIDSKEPKNNRFQGINSASLCSRRAGTTTLFLLGFLAPIDCLKIPA
jgi:hypothetical protein